MQEVKPQQITVTQTKNQLGHLHIEPETSAVANSSLNCDEKSRKDLQLSQRFFSMQTMLRIFLLR